MKTIKNRKTVRDTFVFVLLLMLLLSSMIGTIVAVKPDSPPGKPDNTGPKPDETWNLEIQIGTAGEDIVLQDPPLSAEDVPCSAGLWNIPDPDQKGKSRRGSYVSAQFSLVKAFGDDCGTYTLAHKLGTNSYNEPDTYLDLVIPGSTEYYLTEVDIGHYANPDLGQDYWWFRLIWNPQVPVPGEWGGYALYVWTDKGSDGEVMPPEGNELVIPFEDVDAVLTGDMFGPIDVPENYDWLGSVSFTITINREPHIA